MAQEIYRPGQKLPAEQRVSDQQNLTALIESASNEVNIFARWRAHLQASKNAATVLVEMKKDMADIQRTVVQNYANLIAREYNIKLTDQFQAKISDVTKRVYERTTDETKYYWGKLKEQLDYYDEFFGANIREIEEKVASGKMAKEDGDERIKEYKRQRMEQQEQDKSIIASLREASTRIVERALQDFHPS